MSGKCAHHRLPNQVLNFPFHGLVPVVIGVTGHRDIPDNKEELANER